VWLGVVSALRSRGGSLRCRAKRLAYLRITSYKRLRPSEKESSTACYALGRVGSSYRWLKPVKAKRRPGTTGATYEYVDGIFMLASTMVEWCTAPGLREELAGRGSEDTRRSVGRVSS